MALYIISSRACGRPRPVYTLELCIQTSRDLFPNMHNILPVLLTMPVSILRQLSAGLNGLAMLHIHHNGSFWGCVTTVWYKRSSSHCVGVLNDNSTLHGDHSALTCNTFILMNMQQCQTHSYSINFPFFVCAATVLKCFKKDNCSTEIICRVHLYVQCSGSSLMSFFHYCCCCNKTLYHSNIVWVCI